MIALVMVGLFLAGLMVQRWGQARRMRDGMWWMSYNLLAPLISFAGFASVAVSGRLLGAFLAVVVASWLVLALSRVYARHVGPDPAERGAIALAGAFGNTSFLGLPVAGLFFGDPGVALMALYAQLRWVLPEIAVTVATAEAYGERGRTPRLRSLARYVVNPPTIAALLTVVLRLVGVDMVEQGLLVGRVMAQIAGPFGFLLLGLSLPLDPWSGSGLTPRDLGALVIRHAISPLCLLLVAAVLRVHVPPVFILGSAMPCAFNLVVIAGLFEVDARKTRSLVLISTALALAAILIASLAR